MNKIIKYICLKKQNLWIKNKIQVPFYWLYLFIYWILILFPSLDKDLYFLCHYQIEKEINLMIPHWWFFLFFFFKWHSLSLESILSVTNHPVDRAVGMTITQVLEKLWSSFFMGYYKDCFAKVADNQGSRCVYGS